MAAWSGGHIDMTVQWPTSPDVRVFDLGTRLEAGMPRHPYHPPFAFSLAKQHGEFPYPDGVSSAMELITTGGHVGTHVDALGHISKCGEIHGGREVLEAQSHTGGLEVGSVEEIPPLIGAGHLVDCPKLFGRDLTPADEIDPARLEEWFADRPEPGRGSIVLVRTGWMRHWDDANAYIGLETGLPGVTREGAEWLSSRGILASGSDTMNYEHKVVGVVCLSVHLHYLVEAGVFIMESLDLEELAAEGVEQFTFFAMPLKIAGGTGSPIRPVAIVPR